MERVGALFATEGKAYWLMIEMQQNKPCGAIQHHFGGKSENPDLPQLLAARNRIDDHKITGPGELIT